MRRSHLVLIVVIVCASILLVALGLLLRVDLPRWMHSAQATPRLTRTSAPEPTAVSSDQLSPTVAPTPAATSTPTGPGLIVIEGGNGQQPISTGQRTPQPRTPTPTAVPTVAPVLVGNVIANPRPNTAVNWMITVTGTAQPVANGHELWLMLYVDAIDRYYPGEGAIVVNADGSWKTILTIGAQDDVGHTYVIYLMDAGPQQVQQINAYEANETQTHQVVGIAPSDLNPDHRMLTSVPVNRQ